MKISPSSTKPRSKWKVHCGGLLFSSPLRERLTIFITKTGTFFSIMTFILKKGGKKVRMKKFHFLFSIWDKFINHVKFPFERFMQNRATNQARHRMRTTPKRSMGEYYLSTRNFPALYIPFRFMSIITIMV